MTDYHAFIRQARAALDLIMTGAIKRIEDQFPDGPSPERDAQTDDLIEHMREELDSWLTTKQIAGPDDAAEEPTDEDGMPIEEEEPASK